jgi:hypothetical protein
MGSYLAVPLTYGGGLPSGVKLKKHDQELTLGSKVGLLQESGRTPRRPRAAGCSQEPTFLGTVEQRLDLFEVAIWEPSVNQS